MVFESITEKRLASLGLEQVKIPTSTYQHPPPHPSAPVALAQFLSHNPGRLIPLDMFTAFHPLDEIQQHLPNFRTIVSRARDHLPENFAGYRPVSCTNNIFDFSIPQNQPPTYIGLFAPDLPGSIAPVTIAPKGIANIPILDHLFQRLHWMKFGSGVRHYTLQPLLGELILRTNLHAQSLPTTLSRPSYTLSRDELLYRSNSPDSNAASRVLSYRRSAMASIVAANTRSSIVLNSTQGEGLESPVKQTSFYLDILNPNPAWLSQINRPD